MVSDGRLPRGLGHWVAVLSVCWYYNNTAKVSHTTYFHVLSLQSTHPSDTTILSDDPMMI